MKRWLVMGLAILLVAAGAWGAEKFEDKALGIALEAPEGFEALADRPELPSALGEVKAIFGHKERAGTAGLLFVHHMEIPDGEAYDAFKTQIGERLQGLYGVDFKVVKQEDIEVAGRKGFVLEFQVPGNGMLPEPNGNVQHHVRWHLLRDGETRLIGIAFHSRESAWKDLAPKFDASYKTLKKAD